MRLQLTLIISFLLFLTNCNPLPEKKLSQFKGKIVEYEVHNDSLRIKIDNPINCPLRIFSESSVEAIQEKIANHFPVTLNATEDTLLTYWTDKSKDELHMSFSASMGNPNDSIHKKNISFPFMEGRKYKVIQGYNGRFSHTSEYSRYALDFSLAEGDTVCAAANGFVVGVVEGYKRGGKTKKWRDYANFITVFHPEMNLYTQYVHLMYEGSLVEVGEHVTSGQAIGRSGKTGFTDVEHLHFNVLEANDAGIQSTQISFSEGYDGAELKKGDWIEK